ncbi:hypothetical protein BATDEDRAFT_89744 [Batrachochytrium dendrobatidis JAM81]|uniref:Nucleoporin Nup188 N-terminal subdomain III domain-containing protein n=1 Tax=Batrachochytrium dendrobatidis (strain JAM81 / FGSC 10211) TaxID=684364 RepID=F4P5X2_BATDJ|nr:uncharacterized protein BATDEDRAFT_89744 [Batrachochytrium dendrobatidis JAM81]EGF79503.1 hypothetical protein BATDEDRAFT_89744 [Batrachochytrium dendrobatidis JAM81]|eukprot:XP_006680182.1 hypothetical protein BATDEDRAFT_89744 [Batrachochytrium dendrobatidis JAM81]
MPNQAHSVDRMTTAKYSPNKLFKTTISCQSLLRALEDPVFSSKDLHSSLVEYEPFHILGVNYYQPPSSASRSLVESKQIQLQNIKLTICDDKELAFLLRMSDHFDLDQVQCLLILRECIEHVELTPVSLRAIVSEGKPKYDDETFAFVQDYYFHERLNKLSVLATMLRISYDPSHFHHQIVSESLENILSAASDDGALFYSRILSQLTATGVKNIPTHFQVDPDLAHIWSCQNLEEQIALAEILVLLFYVRVPCSPFSITSVYSTLYQFSFGVDQPNRSYFKETQHKRMSYLNHLCNVVCAETFRFENCIDFNHSTQLFDDSADYDQIPALFSDMADTIWSSLQDRPSHLPGNFDALANMSWAIFQQVLVLRIPAIPTGSARDFLLKIRDNSSVSDHGPQRLLQHSYLSQNVFEGLLQSLGQSPYHGEIGSCAALKSILKGVFMAFFTTQNVPSLPKRNILVNCMSKLFSGEGELCKQFWDEDYPVDERRSLLDSTRRHFPIEFSHFLELVGSLTSSAETSVVTLAYLSEITSFSDLLRSGYEPAPNGVFGEQFHWTGGPLVFGSRSVSFCAPVGTLATLSGEGTVILNMHYSAWVLFEVLLESFLFKSNHIDDALAPGPLIGTGETTLAILKFLSIFFSHAARSTVNALMVHLSECSLLKQYAPTHNSERSEKQRPEERLVALLSLILDRVCLQQSPHLELVTYCLDTLRLLLAHYPSLVWRHLRSHMLLPHYSITPLAPQQPSTSYIQRSILPLERSSGSYLATKSFLLLFQDLLDDSQGTLQAKWSYFDSMDILESFDTQRAANTKADSYQRDGLFDDVASRTEVLQSILSFLIYDVFPTYRSWRYQNISDKFQIGVSILAAFNKILDHVCWANEKFASLKGNTISTDMTPASSYAFVVNAFLQADSSQYASALLELIGTGNESLLYLHRHHRSVEANLLERCVTDSLRFAGSLILCRIKFGRPLSVLENMLLDRTIKRSASSPVDLVHIVGRYVFYEHNLNLSKEAIHLLTLVCQATSDVHSKSVSFVGYFGKDAQAFADSLSRIVRNDGATIRYNSEMQDAVLHFVTTALKSQPGLSALLFAPGTASITDFYRPALHPIAAKSANSGTTSEKKQSPLILAVMDIITDWKQGLIFHPFVLVSSMRLFDLIWQNALDHRNTLSFFRQSKFLWNILHSMLTVTSVEVLSQCKSADDTEPVQMSAQNDLIPCVLNSLQSFALHILTLEAYFSIGVAGISDAHRSMIQKLVGDAFLSKDLFAVIFNNEPFPLGSGSFEAVHSLVKQEHPPVNLSLYCIPQTATFSRQSLFGKRYMFDIDVLARQFVATNSTQGVFPPSSLFSNRKKTLQYLGKLNWEWSRADSFLQLLQSMEFSIEVLCVQLWDIIWPKKGSHRSNKLAEESHTFQLIVSLTTLLNNDKRSEPVILRYRTLCARMIRVLTISWIRSKTLTASAEPFQGNALAVSEHLQLIGSIQVALTSPSPYGLGPVGYLSIYEFHIELLMSALLLIHSISEKYLKNKGTDSSVSETRIAEVCEQLVSFICQALSFVLSADLTDTHNSHLRIGHALMIELLELKELRSSVWLSSFDRFQIIPLMLNIISKADTPFFEHCPESFDMILNTILCISSNPRFAERLAIEGILTAISSSAFASQMINGIVGTITLQVSARMHRSWGLTLSILTQMLDALGHSPQFAFELISILKLLMPNLLSTFEAVATGPILFSNISELEHASELVLSLTQVLGARSHTLGYQEPEILSTLQNASLYILSYFTHLFSSPLELAAICDFAIRSNRTATTGDVAPAQLESEHIHIKMRRITRNLISLLVITTNAETAMLSGSDITIHNTTNSLVLLQKLTLVRDETSSFGTLFSLIRQILGFMESSTRSTLTIRQRSDCEVCIQIIEGLLLLLLSQLFVCQTLCENTEDIATEMLQTLDEMKQVLSLKGNTSNPMLLSAASSLEIVAFLDKICQRRLRVK